MGSTPHFTFDLPQGIPGIDGINGTPRTDGNNIAPGIQGPPGEVTTAQFDTAFSDTSSNTNSVGLLNMKPSDPPSQSEIQQLASKLDELITALQR